MTLDAVRRITAGLSAERDALRQQLEQATKERDEALRTADIRLTLVNTWKDSLQFECNLHKETQAERDTLRTLNHSHPQGGQMKPSQIQLRKENERWVIALMFNTETEAIGALEQLIVIAGTIAGRVVELPRTPDAKEQP